MRWKLLIIASLVATIISAGAVLGVSLGFTGSFRRPAALDLNVFLTLLIPVAAIIAASIFVYRHTARHRKLQAISTALLATILTLATLFISSIFYPKPETEPSPIRRNVG